ncbi:hypothetical protein BH10PSE12_BH10PSE12_11980 [soil metagenome]
MKRIALLIMPTMLAAASPVSTPASSPPHWTHGQVARLLEWLTFAADDGLASVTPQSTTLRDLLSSPDQAALDTAATQVAITLLSAYRNGCCNASLRTGWHIAPDPGWTDPAAAVADAVDRNQIDPLFSQARPSHPFYVALRKAYAREQDPAKRATLAANMDRWRWMPRDLGSRYLLVNGAAFEASLWENRQMIGRWKVVVGKTQSPTPIFAASVTGIIFNPWWEIPSSIAAESVAAIVRNRPAEAARRGYVREGGRYRQRPGPGNSLGRMKLIMPNAYSVYLHDTPSQGLFAKDVRAYSHGCVRVGDALGLAAALLATRSDWARTRIDAVVAAGQTQKVDLPSSIPVYMAYFTAEPDGIGGMRYFPDIYHRDTGASAPADDGQCDR